jgi:hypothetical protein
LRSHQSNIRSDLYRGLEDALIREDVNVVSLGRRFILPSTFTSGPRFMAIVCHYFSKIASFLTSLDLSNNPSLMSHLITCTLAVPPLAMLTGRHSPLGALQGRYRGPFLGATAFCPFFFFFFFFPTVRYG